jgi:hypothetical protein
MGLTEEVAAARVPCRREKFPTEQTALVGPMTARSSRSEEAEEAEEATDINSRSDTC